MTSLRINVFCLLCILNVADVSAKGSEPLISADSLINLGYQTKDLSVDLVYWMVGSAYGVVSPHTAVVEKAYWEQHANMKKLYDQHAKVHADPAVNAVMNAKATITNVATPMIFQLRDIAFDLKDKVLKQLSALADVAVEKFEKTYPHRKGAIPKDADSRAILFVYLSIVAYVALRVFKIVFGIFKGLFCYFFCCGMCAKRAKTTKGAQKAKAKAPAAPTPKKKGGK